MGPLPEINTDLLINWTLGSEWSWEVRFLDGPFWAMVHLSCRVMEWDCRCGANTSELVSTFDSNGDSRGRA